MFKSFAYLVVALCVVLQSTNAFATPEQNRTGGLRPFIAQAPLKIQPAQPISKSARTLIAPARQPVYNRPTIRKPRFGSLKPAAVTPTTSRKSSSRNNQTDANFIDTKFKLHVKINLKTQRMRVYRRGRLQHIWAISGGTSQYPTPVGAFDVDRMYPMFIATNWNDSKMPSAIFFEGDYAIHGTDKLHKLGQPASHGCVRLHPVNARLLYDMVQKTGQRGTQIEVIS